MTEPSSTIEHLSPHDLVSYFRCPYEMELHRARRSSLLHGTAVATRTPVDVLPVRHSPLFPPPTIALRVFEGPVDLTATDLLVYVDTHERGLPVLFPPERVQPDPRFTGEHSNLIDPELGLSGRPDLIFRRGDAQFIPVEYKSTHLFVGYHTAHGRLFDVIQAIAECRLVEAAFGHAPPFGLVLYGDAERDGEHEGWVEIPYGEAERRWLHQALAQVRGDTLRPPAPSEGHCAHCEQNRDALCRFAAVPFASAHPAAMRDALPR